MLQVVPFTDEHLDQAARVLARMHAANRKHEPLLPARYEEPAFAHDALKATCAGGSGVAALRDGRLVGYLVARLEVEFMERAALVLPSGSAIDPGEEAALYPEMYAHAAERWVAAGYFNHFVHVAACDDRLVKAWFGLGFGAFSVYNGRSLDPVSGPEAEIRIRRATSEDFHDQERLREGLRRYNATSPILHPLTRSGPDDARRLMDAERAAMGDGANAYFIAYEGDQPVGLMIFRPPEPDYLLTPDGAVYLHIAFVGEGARSGGIGAAMVNRGFEWARSQGYERCTVGYYSPNLLGARFWQGKGFMPLGYCLQRRIDERIAWAKGPV